MIMSFALINNISSLLKTVASIPPVRFKWVDHRMIKDYKRRMLLTEKGPDRLRVNALRKNDILPKELREIADAEIHAFPLNSCPRRVVGRCVLTSRPRGIINRWRVSRIMFRELAEYNKMSGIQKALW